MSHNLGKIIGGDFLSKQKTLIPRLAVRAFIYKNVLNNKIRDLSNRSIKFVMNKFSMLDKGKNKVKHLIENILRRDNVKLPAIIFANEQCNITNGLTLCDERIKLKSIECQQTERTDLHLVKNDCKELVLYKANHHLENRSSQSGIHRSTSKRKKKVILNEKRRKLQSYETE